MDAITPPSLLPPPAFVPHFGNGIRYGYAMTTIRYARAIVAHVSAASLPPTPGCPQARFNVNRFDHMGSARNVQRTFRAGLRHPWLRKYPTGIHALSPRRLIVRRFKHHSLWSCRLVIQASAALVRRPDPASIPIARNSNDVWIGESFGGSNLIASAGRFPASSRFPR
ncbi:hypothetical protein [Neorhodopirellula lusitana]|uniref:hypothetical protein n=1 Tax=Neorhodopirellula lusitana TaxID=445327 RepID=UPI00385046A1